MYGVSTKYQTLATQSDGTVISYENVSDYIDQVTQGRTNSPMNPVLESLQTTPPPVKLFRRKRPTAYGPKSLSYASLSDYKYTGCGLY